MDVVLGKICDQLDVLADFFKGSVNTETGNQIFSEVIGWDSPAISGQDLALLTRNLIKDIRLLGVAELDPESAAVLDDFGRRLHNMRHHMISSSGDFTKSTTFVQSYLTTMLFIRSIVVPPLDLMVLPEAAFPISLAKRAELSKIILDRLDSDVSGIAGTINSIKLVYSEVHELQASLEALRIVKEAHVNTTEDMKKKIQEIESMQVGANVFMASMSKIKGEAEDAIKECNIALGGSTTVVLAKAFDDRAKELRRTMYLWVVALIVTFAVGGVIGIFHLNDLSRPISVGENSLQTTMHIVLAVLSLGAPIWFGWICSKQIGYRFRLSEDYAFKATLAKSYVGYQGYAAGLDPRFEKKLFTTALKRLDEEPLRFVGKETHASPWHEFLESRTAKRLFELAPDVQERLLKMFREAIASVGAEKERGKNKESGKDKEAEKT